MTRTAVAVNQVSIERIVKAHVGLGGLLRRLVGSTDHLGQGTEFEIESVGPYILVEDAAGLKGPNQPPFGSHPHAGLLAVSWIPEGGRWHSPTNVNDEVPTVDADEVLVTFAGRGVIHDETTATEGVHDLMQIILRLPAEHRRNDAWLRKAVAVDEGGGVRRAYDRTTLEGTGVDAAGFHVTLNAGERASIDVEAAHVGFAYARRGTMSVAGQQLQEMDIALLAPGGGQLEVDAETDCELFVALGAPIDEPWAKLLGNGGFVVAADADSAAAKMAEYESAPEAFGR